MWSIAQFKPSSGESARESIRYQACVSKEDMQLNGQRRYDHWILAHGLNPLTNFALSAWDCDKFLLRYTYLYNLYMHTLTWCAAVFKTNDLWLFHFWLHYLSITEKKQGSAHKVCFETQYASQGYYAESQILNFHKIILSWIIRC